MTDMMVKIIVEVIDILGTATKEMKQSRASEFMLYLRLFKAHICAEKFLKKIAGITKLEDGLQKLDKMTSEEARMASVESLRLAYDIDKKVEGVDEKVKSVDEKVQGVEGSVKVVESKVQTVIDGARVWLVINFITYLIFPDSKQTAAMLRKVVYDVDDVTRSSSVSLSPTFI